MAFGMIVSILFCVLFCLQGSVSSLEGTYFFNIITNISNLAI